MRRLRLAFSATGDATVNDGSSTEACSLLGLFPSLEVCEAAFTTGITAAMDYKQNLVFLRCHTASLADAEATLPTPAGAAVSGEVVGISSLWRQGRGTPSWCLSLKTLVQAKGSNEPTEVTIRVLMQGLLRYRSLLRLGGKLKLAGINRIKYDDKIDAYAASEASVITRYSEPKILQEVWLKVVDARVAVLVCIGPDKRRLTLDISDWAPNQKDVISSGCVISVGNALAIGDRALALCRHSNVILEETGGLSVEARELQTFTGCATHRSAAGWDMLKTGKKDALSDKCAVVLGGPSVSSLITECRCFSEKCENVTNRSPPLLLFADAGGVVDFVSGDLTPDMRVADKSYPLGLPILCKDVPHWRCTGNGKVNFSNVRFSAGCILWRGVSTPNHNPGDALMIITRLDADSRSVKGLILGGRKCQYENVPHAVFSQLEPLCWLGIGTDCQLRRVKAPQSSFEVVRITVQASWDVACCKSVAEALRLSAGDIIFFQQVIVTRVEPLINPKGAQGLLLKGLNIDLSTLAVTSLNDSTGVTLPVIAATKMCRGIPVPFVCDMIEVALDYKPNSEPSAVVLRGGRIIVRAPAVPRGFFTSTGSLVTVNTVKAFVQCKTCRKVKYPLVACGCEIADYSMSVTVSFTVELVNGLRAYEVTDDKALQLLTAVKAPYTLFDTLERQGGILVIEEVLKIEPVREIRLTHDLHGKVEEVIVQSRECVYKKKFG